MDSLKKLLKNSAYIFSVLLISMIIFANIACIYLDNTFFNYEFHKQIFIKNNIYSHMHEVLNNSMEDFISNLKTISPKSFEDQKELINALEKSFTLEMVQMNLDSIINGVLLYIRGEDKMLPDIYLNSQKQSLSQITGNLSSQSDITSQALEKIDKINLGTVLNLINRSDINDDISICKLFYFIVKALPGFSILLILLFAIIWVIIAKSLISSINLAIRSLALGSFISILTGTFILVYTYYFMPLQIIPISMSLPLNKDTTISYLKDVSLNTSFFLILTGISLIVMSFILKFLFKLIIKKLEINNHILNIASNTAHMKKIKWSYILFSVLILVSIMFKYHSINSDFKTNNFSNIVEKIKNKNNIMQVISAQDDTFFSLNVKLLEDKTLKPISNTKINISGKSDLLKKNFNVTSSTDNDGVARYALDKGTFKLSFVPSDFPSNYSMPSPLFFDIKSAGTTTITVNLNILPEVRVSTSGFAEIEILDKYNNPVQNAEMILDLNSQKNNINLSIHAITNSDGIAVFKSEEGTYKVNFIDKSFPKEYIVPKPIDIDIKTQITSRYIIRLSESKPVQVQPSNVKQGKSQ